MVKNPQVSGKLKPEACPWSQQLNRRVYGDDPPDELQYGSKELPL